MFSFSETESHYVDQAGLEFREINSSAFLALRLKTSSTAFRKVPNDSKGNLKGLTLLTFYNLSFKTC